MNITAYRRKLIYIAAIVAILVPLYVLGQPSVIRDDKQTSAGGTLAQIREKYDLGQGDLGKLDPASESARLATLGLRGVATSILWHKANTYKTEQNWDRLSATLNQIALLQPHFIKVWEFQAHNLAYNTSVEFDDYRQRYAWVKRGMEYLSRGIDFNRRDANLPHFQGMIFGQKLGKADEHKQFRKLFSNDGDFHDELEKDGFDAREEEALGPDRLPDNWLVGRLWYKRAEAVYNSGNLLPNSFRKGPLQFFSSAPLTLMNFSEAVESEGILDERAQEAWSRSDTSWRQFGDLVLPTTWGHTLRLNDLEKSNERITELRKQFQDYAGPLYQQALDERYQQLSPEQRVALETPDDKKTEQQFVLAVQAKELINPSAVDIARKLPQERLLDGIQLATRVENEETIREHIDNYRNQVNYNYWETRAKAEQTELALQARQSLYDAETLLADAELDEALKKYDVSWKLWKELFDLYPVLMTDEKGGDEVLEALRRYSRAIDSELPEDFILGDFIRIRRQYDETGGDIEKLLEISRANAMKVKSEKEAEERKANETPGEPNQPQETPPSNPPAESSAKPATENNLVSPPEAGEPPAPALTPPPSDNGSGN